MTGLYVLTLGTIPLLLAVVLFAYCSKRQRAPIDWNKSSRKKLPYVFRHFAFARRLRPLVGGGNGGGSINDGSSTTCTARSTRPLHSVNTVSSLVSNYDQDDIYDVYSMPSEASSYYHCAVPEPIYDTIPENAYVNSACTEPQTTPYASDTIKSRLTKSDIVITNLAYTTNPQVNSYLQDGVWGSQNQ